MGDVLEIMLEEIPRASIAALLRDFVGGNAIQSISHSDLGDFDPGKTTLDQLALSTHQPSVLSIMLDRVSLGSVSITRPLVQVITHNSTIDVCVCFERDDFSAPAGEGVYRLKAHLAQFGEKYRIDRYSFGLEPASDEETRFFSEARMGPLRPI